jgi:hypothetical protein
MAKTYDTLEGELSVRGAATTTRTGETNAVAVVGGYDSANAADDVTAGESTYVTDPTGADDTFGESELSRAVATVGANDVGEIYGVPVAETSTTESFTSSQSLSLSEAPIFDPNVHPEHTITVTDTSAGEDLITNVVYDETVATPSDADTANVNPTTGDIETDASSDYDVAYTYGDYQPAIEAAASLANVRYVIVLTEADAVKATLVSELGNIATDFDFKRGVVGARPEIDSGSIGSYTPSQQDWRLVEVAPARATGADGAVRTAAAVGGFMASQPIGPDGSTLYDSVGGLADLNTAYRSSEAKGFEEVTALTRNAVLATAQTTSTEGQFKDVYATEIIDEMALRLFAVARDYAGGPQDVNDLETILEVVCQRSSKGNPPLLGFGDGRDERPYDVAVSLGASNTVADAGVTILPFPIAKEVNLSLTVSDGFVEFERATA